MNNDDTTSRELFLLIKIGRGQPSIFFPNLDLDFLPFFRDSRPNGGLIKGPPSTLSTIVP